MKTLFGKAMSLTMTATTGKQLRLKKAISPALANSDVFLVYGTRTAAFTLS